jgi:hypothetical protein
MTRRTAIAVSLVVMLSSLAVTSSYVFAKKEKAASSKLRVSITNEYTKKTLSVPVQRFDDRPFMSIIRVSGNENGADLNKASAVKIVPYLTEKGVVIVDVSLLFGDVTGITSCEQYKQLKQQPFASFQPREGEMVMNSALKGLGFSALTLQEEMDGGDEYSCGGCWCNPICCIPNPGQCMGCPCGTCCRA